MTYPDSNTETKVDPNIDPLTGLHRMSRTAGAGNQDYVAINATAIAAVVCGLAGVLSLFKVELLLIPFAAIVLAVMSLRQIKHSNGTQTGAGMPVVALLLGLGFFGFRGVSAVVDATRGHADEQANLKLIDDLNRTTKAQDFTAAYALFGQRFHDRVTPERFSATFQNIQKSIGHITLASTGYFDADNGQADPVARGLCKVTLSDGTEAAMRVDMFFRKVNNTWHIDDMPAWFPAETAKK